MGISLHLDAETPSELHDHIRQLFPHMSGGATPVVGQEANAEAPKQTRQRRASTKDAVGEKEAGTSAEATGQSAGTSGQASSETTSATSASGATTAEKNSTSSNAVDIEVLRAKLKELGATKGYGHEKVFEVLGKYGAKNASTVPEDKRGECVGEIDALLANKPAE